MYGKKIDPSTAPKPCALWSRDKGALRVNPEHLTDPSPRAFEWSDAKGNLRPTCKVPKGWQQKNVRILWNAFTLPYNEDVTKARTGGRGEGNIFVLI